MPDPSCPSPTADVLARLAADLVRADAPDAPEPPVAIAVRADALADALDGDGLDADVLPLDGVPDPVALLCHQRPDPAWAAVGVLVDGWTIPPDLDAGVDWRTLVPRISPSRHPARCRVRTLHVVGRGGAVALALLGDGEDEPTVHATEDGGEPGGPCGPLPDALRRMLGLRTPPCPVPAVELWASLWLEAVAALAGRRAPWPTVARLHPGAWLADELGVPLDQPQLVVAGRALARTRDWASLQLQAVTDPGAWDLLPDAGVAAWADAGMFARLVVRQVRPLWSSRADLDRLLAPAVLASVDDVLAAWGLDAAPPRFRAA